MSKDIYKYILSICYLFSATVSQATQQQSTAAATASVPPPPPQPAPVRRTGFSIEDIMRR